MPTKAIISVDPFRCRMWSMHERLEDHINEASCKMEIESYAKHGQLIPVLGRPLRNDPSFDVELIYGARRLFVAQHLNRPLLVELQEMTDKEAIVAMDIENRHRKDVSPYERSLCYAKWLQTGKFESQDDIARTLKISKSQVSRLLKLTKLPSVILSAFECPTDICEGWGIDLVNALEDPERRQSILRRARALNATASRPPGSEIYKWLLHTSGRSNGKLSASAHDEIVKTRTGVALFRIRRQRKSIALLLPADRISNKSLDSIRSFVSNLLQHETQEVPDSKRPGQRASRDRYAPDASPQYQTPRRSNLSTSEPPTYETLDAPPV